MLACPRWEEPSSTTQDTRRAACSLGLGGHDRVDEPVEGVDACGPAGSGRTPWRVVHVPGGQAGLSAAAEILRLDARVGWLGAGGRLLRVLVNAGLDGRPPRRRR